MKVILLKDVAKLGRRYETVEVPNGFALNKLIPGGMAENATKESLKRLKNKIDLAEASIAADSERFDEVVESLGKRKIAVPVELNEQGHMFEALKPAAVVEALAGEGVVISEAMVSITSPIKEAGAHTINLVASGKEAPITIDVVAK